MPTYLARTTINGFLVLPLLFVTMIALSALLLGRLPNAVDALLINNLAFYQILWQGNPLEALKIVVIEKPVLVIEHLDNKSGLQVWGLFYYSGALLVYVLTSVFTAIHWRRLKSSPAKYRFLFVAGVTVSLIGVTYVQRIECCGGGPGWVLDTWLRTKVYTPNAGPVDWLLVYQRIEPWMPALQTGSLLIGFVLLYRWHRGAEQPVNA